MFLDLGLVMVVELNKNHVKLAIVVYGVIRGVVYLAYVARLVQEPNHISVTQTKFNLLL